MPVESRKQPEVRSKIATKLSFICLKLEVLQRQVGSPPARPVTSAVSAATFSGICLIVDLFQVLAGQQESCEVF